MNVTNLTLHSKLADRDFDLQVFGDSGRAVIALPDGDSSCTSWENNGMVAALSELIESGQVQLFCTDSLDASGWYAHGAFSDYRLGNVNAFIDFVAKELAPYVEKSAKPAAKSDAKPLIAGAGIGATNAMLALLAKPDAFGGLLAMSGVYDVRDLVDASELGGEFANEWLAVSPADVLGGLSARTKAVRALKTLPVAFVCGRNSADRELASQHAIEDVLAAKKVQPTFEYWGYDVTPSWYWWQVEAAQLLPCLLSEDGLANRKQVAVEAAAQSEADHAKQVLDSAAAELDAAEKNLDSCQQAADQASERVLAEEAQLESASKTADALADEAREAWAERDRIAELLSQALEAARAAQEKADAANKERSDAEWILGEARASLSASESALVSAKARLEDARFSVDGAEEANATAQSALQKVKAAGAR